ncbi:hypothetical protein [Deinococcus hopiensis]|uniref:Uncharacterized protein n=1 Tax=Deinococcus hopiensis KR-140 TaxID=695939 RepID=A0A1W1VWD6_9DEIO|nr:hypothetical protein [Deinococcus hopiensis]SMB97646.1 hypothetical protein SAMN00790413_06103 [Deinococcus hopiensis KR-140]
MSTRDKEVMNSSRITVYAAGGPAGPQTAVPKSGNFQRYFDARHISLSSLMSVAHTTTYRDDSLMRVHRTYADQTRRCTAIPSKKVELRFREVYGNAVIGVKPSGA